MNSGLAAKDAARWTPGPEGASGVTGRIKSLQALETVFFFGNGETFFDGGCETLLCRCIVMPTRWTLIAWDAKSRVEPVA